MSVEHLRPFFHVIAVISNPIQYESRYNLFWKFKAQMEAVGVNLWVVEVQNGERTFQVTERNNQRHLQLRTEDELWHKENMINLGIQQICQVQPDWKYVAWVDADIEFINRNWIDDTINQLQMCHVVQMFQNAIDVGPTGGAIHTHNGFMWSYWNGIPYRDGYANWHPGFAWAATRQALNGVGNLISKAILGSGDRHMAMALIGKGADSYNKEVHLNYKHMVEAWQSKAQTYIKRDVGFVKGTIVHNWHGRKSDRGYRSRWQILTKSQFDPYADVYEDPQGLLRLEDDRIDLRDDIKKYFRSRNEDSIDLI